MKSGRISLILAACVLFFLYLPIVVLMANSFNESRFGGVWTGFSLKWYSKLWEERAIWTALTNSLIVATFSTLLATLLGTAAALALYKYKSFLQKTHYGLIYIPLIIPDILMGVSLLIFFVSLQWPLGLFTVFIAHTTFCISYVAMLVRARLENFDRSLVEAAYDLGANSWDVFTRVMIPFLSPAILAGALLSFTLSIDDFVITFFVVGPGVTTLPIYVYSMIKFGSPPLINALSTVLIVVTFCIVWFTHHLSEKK
ncbi:MAG: ABC transporter permease [Verrucomicrobia bacterium]|nr:ABC transporter permease [Verrucomicrobiota bacterium]